MHHKYMARQKLFEATDSSFVVIAFTWTTRYTTSQCKCPSPTWWLIASVRRHWRERGAYINEDGDFWLTYDCKCSTLSTCLVARKTSIKHACDVVYTTHCEHLSIMFKVRKTSFQYNHSQHICMVNFLRLHSSQRMQTHAKIVAADCKSINLPAFPLLAQGKYAEVTHNKLIVTISLRVCDRSMTTDNAFWQFDNQNKKPHSRILKRLL